MFVFELIPANHQNMVSQALPGLRARLIIRSGAVLGGRQELDVRRWYPLLWVLSRWKGSVGCRVESEFLALRQVFWLWVPQSGIVTGVTARCGDAPPVPPRPKSKSQAAAPLPIFRRALSQSRLPRLNFRNNFPTQFIHFETGSGGSGIGKGRPTQTTRGPDQYCGRACNFPVMPAVSL